MKSLSNNIKFSNNMEFLSNSQEETIKIAQNFAKNLKKGDIILLLGDLGAGKTHFVKGLAQGLDCKQTVTSPTFTLLNIYKGGKFEIDHFDMYRLSGVEEALAVGFEEYFDRATMPGISVVEWPENVEGLIGQPRIEVKIHKISDTQRKICIRRTK